MKTWVIMVFIYVLIVVYLISNSPQNLPRKAGVFKKTYNVSSQKKCRGSDIIRVGEKKRISILLYHYVEHVKDIKDITRKRMNIDPDTFESQLKSLSVHDYRTVFVRQIPEILKHTSSACELTAALTFDDGYEDFYTEVFPLLKKYNVRATVYIIVNFIGEPNFMNENQINEIIKSGLVEIGSHTFDHPDLSITSDDLSRYQIMESKKALEERFNIPIQTFAYPFGKYKLSDMNLVREASYSAAVTVAPGSMHINGEEYILSRERPENYIGYDLGIALKK